MSKNLTKKLSWIILGLSWDKTIQFFANVINLFCVHFCTARILRKLNSHALAETAVDYVMSCNSQPVLRELEFFISCQGERKTMKHVQWTSTLRTANRKKGKHAIFLLFSSSLDQRSIIQIYWDFFEIWLIFFWYKFNQLVKKDTFLKINM